MIEIRQKNDPVFSLTMKTAIGFRLKHSIPAWRLLQNKELITVLFAFTNRVRFAKNLSGYSGLSGHNKSKISS